MRDERGESVGVSGVPTPLAALFICSCFLCFVKTRRRKFWDVPLLYVLYIYGHIYQVLLYTRADTTSSSGGNTAAVDYQLRTDYMYMLLLYVLVLWSICSNSPRHCYVCTNNSSSQKQQQRQQEQQSIELYHHAGIHVIETAAKVGFAAVLGSIPVPVPGTWYVL